MPGDAPERRRPASGTALGPTPVFRTPRRVGHVFRQRGRVRVVGGRHPGRAAALSLEPGPLGLLLLSIPAGALLGMPLAGWLAPALGSGRLAAVSALCFCAALPLLALAPNAAMLALALCLFGASGGANDVTMNAQASEVQRRMGRPVMSSFHALFSLGGLAGSGVAAAAMAAGVPPTAHFAGVACLGLAADLWASRGLSPPVARPPRRSPAFTPPPASLLGLGALAFAVLLCEGAAADWSAVYLRNDLGAGPALAAAGFGAFSLAMAAGRLCGDRLVRRLGPAALVRGSAALAAAGLGSGLLVAHPWAAVAGFACLGLGCSNVVPVLFSAASRTPGVEPARALAGVTVMGYAAFLAGPALIGMVAQATSLRAALGLLVVAGGVIAASASAVRARPAAKADDQAV